MVRGGSDFKVDIKRDYRGDIKDFREYFMGLKGRLRKRLCGSGMVRVVSV